MSDRSLNWLKFGVLVSLAFVLGLFFAGLLDLPQNSVAQDGSPTPATLAQATPARSIPGAASLATLSDAFAAVAEAVRPSVVFITSRRTAEQGDPHVPPGFEQFFRQQPRGPQRLQGSGSGFIVSTDGYILTNNHVVEGADKVQVRLLDQRTFEAKVIGADPLTDIAVVKIDAKDLQAAVLGSSHDVRVGEWVLAVGNPLGNALTFTVTSGIVSAKGRGQLGLPNRVQTSIQDFIQTDAAINPGNSGGPLLNVHGEVIGINSAIASQTGTYVGYGFAIPVDLVRNVMQQLISTGKVQRAALGVQVGEASAEDAEYVGLKEIRGVTVGDFSVDNSPAERAGIRQGDVIISVDGVAVEYVAQLQQEVGFRRPGDVVKVEVARKGGIRRTYDVALMAQQPLEETAAAGPVEEQDESESGEEIAEIGVTVEPMTPQLASRLDLKADFGGLVVRTVSPESPAADRGQLLGIQDPNGPDIIIAVEGTDVRTQRDLRTALREVGSGKVATLTLYNAAAGARRLLRIRVK